MPGSFPVCQRLSWFLVVPSSRPFCILSSSTTLCPGSTEGERKRLHARIEKLDLELAISDGPRLPDQLVQSLVAHRAAALLVNVTAVGPARRLPIDEHAKAHGRSPRFRSHHEMEIAG